MVPANATPLLRGDINQDAHVNNTDVAALMTALTDINAYKAAHSSLDTFEAGDILDVDQNGAVTNADLQGIANYLKAGNGSVAPCRNRPARCWRPSAAWRGYCFVG